MRQNLTLIFLISSFVVHSQNKIVDYSLPNFTISLDIEKYADSVYSGNATLKIYNTAKNLLNTIYIKDYYYKPTFNGEEQPIDCLVDFNNDGINDICIRTKFDNQVDKREYEVYLFDMTAQVFVKNEEATKFKNANKGKIITSQRTNNRISVYDANDESLRQISEYLFSQNHIQKTKTKTEDFRTDRDYVIVTTELFSKKGSKTSHVKYLKKSYLMDE